MQFVSKVVALALALGVAGCGGGGGGASVPTTNTAKAALDEAAKANTAAVILNLAFYDMAAAPERLMLQAGAHDQLGALPGAAIRTACASGAIDTQKVDPSTFTLTADNCRLSTTDNLVYNGTWRFAVTHTEYNPGGTCTPGAACLLLANVDTSTARFGYGTATEKVVDMQWQQEKSAAGAQITNPFLGNVVDIPDFGKIILNGTPKDFAVAYYSPAALITRIQAPSRTTIAVDVLLKAILTVGDAGVTAAIDTNKDGTADTTTVVPWSTFAE
jgi:hypothetical protein